MVFTAAQNTAFFQVQMGLPQATINHLITEGIDNVDSLEEFSKDEFKQIAANCRQPPGGGAPLVFSARSLHRLLVASNIIKFYIMIGRVYTPQDLRWDPVLKNFAIQWEAIKSLKKADDPATPTLTGTNVIKWSESMTDVLERCIGAQMVPLVYVIRKEVAVPAACPPIAPNKPNTAEFWFR